MARGVAICGHWLRMMCAAAPVKIDKKIGVLIIIKKSVK